MVLGVIFATLLLVMLAGFMHYAVRLFFRVREGGSKGGSKGGGKGGREEGRG